MSAMRQGGVAPHTASFMQATKGRSRGVRRLARILRGSLADARSRLR